ncbi:MAG: S41 family peptidase [Clostridiales bacterium]|nr:S41 family peptidase [Clostridiales bacterium]
MANNKREYEMDSAESRPEVISDDPAFTVDGNEIKAGRPGKGSTNERHSRKRQRGNHGFAKGFLSGMIVAVIAAAAVFSVASGTGSGLLSSTGEKVLDSDTVDKIETLAAYIQNSYYEDVDIEDLRDGLYEGLFENLDVYSQYYTAEEYESLLESSLEGTYCGIGASLQQDTETMMVSVVRVYEGSPAEEAGLEVGDVIYMVDDYEATSMELSELVTHIRGEENTSVHLVTYRNGEEIEYDIERRNLTFPTVSSDMLDGSVGYIAVSEFTDATTEQFSTALDDLQDAGMEALIVDLRSNPGGVLTTVCDMLDEILPEGLILYTEDREGNREEYKSTDDTSLELPLVVLVDENSASASEIFAGAIQDREAGTIVGVTTYGKGVVQSVRTLSDGTAFKVTTHRYYTPGGTCIQDIGITPDVEIEYEFLGGEDDEYSYELDNQIQKALEILQED